MSQVQMFCLIWTSKVVVHAGLSSGQKGQPVNANVYHDLCVFSHTVSIRTYIEHSDVWN